MVKRVLPTAFATGRYQVRRLLGQGAQKIVYLAHDARLERDVALAALKTDDLNATTLARLQREVCTMARLGDHPHIVPVYDVGDESGQPYIVSQYMVGGTVEESVRRADGRRLPIDRVLRMADELCSALSYAHEHRVIHRDLKPSNVWLTADGATKLGDFGLAVALDRSRLTLEGEFVGTAAYMAPEQAWGHPPDERSDLYALGAMLYEMVTGRTPFEGETTVAVLSQHASTPPLAPSWHNAEVPPELDALILRLLAKAPKDRPNSAGVVRETLAAIAADAAAPARPTTPPANPLDRLAGGVFVGRERELAELRAALEAALAGHGALALLVGDPGIGKTRTAEEFATYARLRKAKVLWGRCYEGEGAPAYWPWIQVLRSYVHDRDAATLREEMGSGAADISQVVSDIRGLLPDLPVPPASAPEHARFRLFDAISVFLKNAAKTRPLVIVLDDLHGADKPSLLLLEFVARELRGGRALILGTYRDVEVGRHHPLGQTLGELARGQLSRRIFLRGLMETDVARVIEMTAGLTPPESLVAAVYKETEGNPFFVNEVVRLMVSEGRLERPPGDERAWIVDIPRSIREVIGRRLNRLSLDCNELLILAAAIGREFGADAVERVSGLAAERVLDALDEAVAARVIVEVPRTRSRYSFAHALVRETLYGELSAVRRLRLHRRIGDVLETLYQANPECHLAELAHHFLQAALGGGDVDRAVTYARRAGKRATALLAHEEAVNHYGRALEAIELKNVPDESMRCELLLALGRAQLRAGDPIRARDTFRKAADSARRAGLPEHLAHAALGFAHLGPEFQQSVSVDEVVGLLERALTALPAHDSALRARLLGRLAVALTFGDPDGRKASLSREAVDMAERVGDLGTRATVLAMRHAALFGPGNVEERLATATRVLHLADEAGDEEIALDAHRWRLTALLQLGDIAGVDREIEAYERLARKLRQPLQVSFAATLRGMRALMTGRFADAEAFAAEALGVGPQFQSRVKIALLSQVYWLCRERRRLQELQAVMGEIQEASTQPAAQCGFAAVLCDLGMIAEARSVFEQFATNDFADVPQDFAWLPAMTALVDACTFLGDVPRAATLYRLLLPHTGRNITVANATFCFGPVTYYLGRLAALRGRHAEAIEHFEQALAMGEAMGARPIVAQSKRAYAMTLLARGDRERCLQMLNEALDTARELGMTVLLEQALADRAHAEEGSARELGA